MKIQQWLLKVLRKQSVTDGQTDARTDNVKTVYPPQTKFAGGIIIFLFLNQYICCGYSKEPSQWEGSFEHPKHMLGNKWNFLLNNFAYLFKARECESAHLESFVFKSFETYRITFCFLLCITGSFYILSAIIKSKAADSRQQHGGKNFTSSYSNREIGRHTQL